MPLAAIRARRPALSFSRLDNKLVSASMTGWSRPSISQIELMQRKSDAMIGHAILREVVCADLFAAIAGPNHALALRADLRELLFELDLVQPRPQNLHGLGAILDLRFFVLAGDNQTRRQVRNPNSRISGVHRLAARTGRTERIDAQVLRIDLHIHFVRFRHHRDRDGRGMDAALLFRSPERAARDALRSRTSCGYTLACR